MRYRIARLLLLLSLTVSTVGFGAPAGAGLPGPVRAAEPGAPPRIRTAAVHPGRPGIVHLRFPATHLVWSWNGREGSGIRFQTLRPGDAAWTQWSRAFEAHDLESGSRHHSGLVPVAGVTAVRWAARDGRTVRNVRLESIDASQGPGPSPLRPAPASEDGSPAIVTRAQWGADESLKRTTGSCKRRFYPVQQLFVHHTAGANFDSDPYATMRAIYWYHTQRQGWCDIGYNFVIGWDGTIFEGRWAREYGPWEVHTSEARNGRAVAGAHVASFNAGSVGISVMGNFQRIDAPPAVRRSLAELLAWEVDRHGLDPLGRHTYRDPEDGSRHRLRVIAGHRDAGSTACPGDTLYRDLPAVRRDTAAAVGAGKTTTSLFLQADAETIDHGSSVSFSGRLTDESGTPIPLVDLDVFARQGDDVWAQDRSVTTGADGAFGFDLTPEANLEVVVTYGGDSGMWGAQSDLASVGVAPLLTLEAEGGSTDEDGVAHFAPGTPVVPLAGSLTPVHAGGRIVMRVARINDDGSRTNLTRATVTMTPEGTYRYEFASPIPPQGVTFRALARFKGDVDHKRSASPPILFTVDV